MLAQRNFFIAYEPFSIMIVVFDYNMDFKLLSIACLVSCVFSQAPGDGDSLCVDPLIDNATALTPNPFFALRPNYPANVRPLIDSRDYLSLLDDPNPAWQQVDNDTSNSGGGSTHVSCACSCRC